MRALFGLMAVNAVMVSAHLGNLESPKAGDVFKAGTKVNVSWSVLVEHDTQDLAYSTDGSTWTNIVTGLRSAQNGYAWTVPNIQAAKVRLRVCQRDGAQVKGCTDAHNTTSPTSFQVPGGDVYTMVSGSFSIQAAPTALAGKSGGTGRRAEGNASYGNAAGWFAVEAADGFRLPVFDARGRRMAPRRP